MILAFLCSQLAQSDHSNPSRRLFEQCVVLYLLVGEVLLRNKVMGHPIPEQSWIWNLKKGFCLKTCPNVYYEVKYYVSLRLAPPLLPPPQPPPLSLCTTTTTITAPTSVAAQYYFTTKRTLNVTTYLNLACTLLELLVLNSRIFIDLTRDWKLRE